MLKQIYNIDTKVKNPIFKKTYLANAFINPRRMLQTFYKIDLLLKYQNEEFK